MLILVLPLLPAVIIKTETLSHVILSLHSIIDSDITECLSEIRMIDIYSIKYYRSEHMNTKLWTSM